MANCKFCGCPTRDGEDICEHCARELDDVSVAGTDVKMVPPEAKAPNWGGFLFNWLWAANHKIYFPLIAPAGIVVGYFLKDELMKTMCFIIFGAIWVAVSLFLLKNGGELAWQKRDFDTVEQFVEVQQIWMRWAFVLILFIGVMLLSGISGIIKRGI